MLARFDRNRTRVFKISPTFGFTNSAVLSRFAKNEFNLDSESTLGVDFMSRNITIDGKTVRAQTWDIAGEEQNYRPIITASVPHHAAEALAHRTLQILSWCNRCASGV